MTLMTYKGTWDMSVLLCFGWGSQEASVWEEDPLPGRCLVAAGDSSTRGEASAVCSCGVSLLHLLESRGCFC